MNQLSLILFAFLISTLSLQVAYAWPRGDSENGIFEDVFRRAPVVFTGIAHERHPSQEGIPFTVTHMYKSPWSKNPKQIYLNKEKKRVTPDGPVIFSTYWGKPNFDPGKEYVVFAYEPQVSGSTYYANTDMEVYNTSVAQNLKELRHANKAEAQGLFPHVFVGRLTRIHQLKRDDTVIPDRILQFKIQRVFNNYGPPPKPRKSALYSLEVSFCKERFQIGKDYLVYASYYLDEKSYSRQSELPTAFGKVSTYVDCYAIWPMDEKKILESLSKGSVTKN